MFGRERRPDEVDGIAKDIILARAADPELHERGQDGGLVSAILLWALDHGYIDAALVSYLEGDGTSWKAIPGVARTRDDIIASAGSRYTYSANTMAYAEAVAGGAEKLALVGMSCQSSVPPVMTVRKAGKPARRFVLNIGLLCSKTFDDAIFEELFEAKYGLKKQDMVKMNIKGVFQIWMRNGDYHEVPLKECHAWTREGCKTCPDFAAEHADISTGGIGAYNDWTLTIVRTDIGREILIKMLEDGTHRGPAGRRRPRRHRPAAQAVAREPQALAGDRGRRASPDAAARAQAPGARARDRVGRRGPMDPGLATRRAHARRRALDRRAVGRVRRRRRRALHAGHPPARARPRSPRSVRPCPRSCPARSPGTVRYQRERPDRLARRPWTAPVGVVERGARARSLRTRCPATGTG